MGDRINVGDIYEFNSNHNAMATDGKAYWICTNAEPKSDGSGAVYYGFTNEAVGNTYIVPVIIRELTNTIKFSMSSINFATFMELSSPTYYDTASVIELDEIYNMLSRRIYNDTQAASKEDRVFFAGSVVKGIDGTKLIILRNSSVNTWDGWVLTNSDDMMEPFSYIDYNMDQFKLIGLVPYDTYQRLVRMHQLDIRLYQSDKYWKPL